MYPVLLYLLLAQIARLPDYEPLTRAYEALRTKSYDSAIAAFEDRVCTPFPEERRST